MRRIPALVALLAVGLLLAGCSIFGSGEGEPVRLVETSWQLSVLQTPDGDTTPADSLVGRPDTSASYTLTFKADGRLGGVADCNRYGADYAVQDGGVLSVDSLVSTQQYCGEASREALYVESLLAADAYEVDDGALRIHFDGEGTLRFERDADS